MDTAANSHPDFLTPLERRPTTIPSADAQKEVLVMCDEIRLKLESAGHLLGNFPILELDNCQARKTTYLGFTFLVRRDNVLLCEQMGVILRSRDGTAFPTIRVLPTLIHEFAHVLRESIRGDISKMDSSCHDCHDDEFYNCFKKLLVTCEDIGIYTLPSAYKSKTHQALRRFDKIDLALCALSCCGTSESYYKAAEPDFVRVIVCDKKGTKKPVTLTTNQTVVELLKVANQKLNLRPKAKKAQTLQGKDLDDATLQALELDTVVKVL